MVIELACLQNKFLLAMSSVHWFLSRQRVSVEDFKNHCTSSDKFTAYITNFTWHPDMRNTQVKHIFALRNDKLEISCWWNGRILPPDSYLTT